MRDANKAINREKHPTPTIDDIVSDLNKASSFSQIDITAGYHQLELSPESLTLQHSTRLLDYAATNVYYSVLMQRLRHLRKK